MPSLVNAQNAKSKKVLILGIDGLIWQAIDDTNAPNLNELKANSRTYTNALAELPTWSATGWSGILTGVSVAKHNVTGNDFANNRLSTYPSFFKYLKLANSESRFASLVSWGEINQYINLPEYAPFSRGSMGVSYEKRDETTASNVINELSYDLTNTIFVQFDQVDHYGHESGFSTTNPDYTKALKNVDGLVGNILTTLKNRPNYVNEDWLIIAVTDHGGTSNGDHGGDSYAERNAFIILNNSAITPALINDQPDVVIKTQDYPIQTVDFNGAVYGKIPTSAGLNFGTDKNFTIELRVKSTSSSSDPCVLGNKDWNSGNNKGIAIVNRNGSIRVNIGDGSNRDDYDLVSLSDNYWHHISVVVNRTAKTMKLFDSGILAATRDITSIGDITSGMDFCIGQDGTTTYSPFFIGNVAEIRIFNAAVSDDDILSYASKAMDTNHPSYNNLLVYTPGAGTSNEIFTGGLGKADIPLYKGSSSINWVSYTNKLFCGKTEDDKGAPYLYDIAPTVFSFLNLPAKSSYNWDGKALVNFAATSLFVDDFEESVVWNNVAANDVRITENPYKIGLNKSDYVLEITKAQGGDDYGGAIKNDITGLNIGTTEGSFRYAHVKMYKTIEGRVTLKLEGGPGGANKETDVENVPANTWIDVVFDLEAVKPGAYTKVFIMPDKSTNASVTYCDDVVFNNIAEAKIATEDPFMLPAPTESVAIIENFENGWVNFTPMLNSMESADFDIVSNPQTNGINTSNYALKITRTVAGSNSWAGFWANLTQDTKMNRFDTDKYSYVSFKFMRETGGAEVKFKFERSDTGGPTKEITPMAEYVPQKLNEWEQIFFDLKNNGAKGPYNTIAIMPDFATGRPVNTVYIDDIIVSTSLETGIKNISAILSSIYVTNDEDFSTVHFSAEETNNLYVNVFNASGQTVWNNYLKNVQIGSNELTIPIKEKGVFLIKLTIGDKSVVSKFVK